MATKRDGNCPVCQDSWKDGTSALPCHHCFCLGCILQWTHKNPSCSLCRTLIETVRFSEQDEWDYVQPVITSPAESPEACSLAGRTPHHLDKNGVLGLEVSPPSSPQGTLSRAEQSPSGPEPVSGLLPEVWAGLFQQNQRLLEPMRPWLCQRLEQIYHGQWWLVEATESCFLRYLCICGLDAEALAQTLLVFLEGHTALLVHGLIEVVAAQCSEEAQRLLHSHTAGDEDNSQQRAPAPADPSASVSAPAAARRASHQWLQCGGRSWCLRGHSPWGSQPPPTCAQPCRVRPAPEGAGAARAASSGRSLCPGQQLQPLCSSQSGQGLLAWGEPVCPKKEGPPGVWILRSPARGHDGTELTPEALREPCHHFRLNDETSSLSSFPISHPRPMHSMMPL
ncbi:hypothetical protein DUI87_00524 [Hirundo rustica rustica]|uniref:RING-type domain-containing protein n=1 Tax=Hirundo rustica rustica TaxID=333673 RepID=A0A3M0LA78_HIRRU|nr:hypothetical protein DUI87_00524 [Hirundo rustica rustica]